MMMTTTTKLRMVSSAYTEIRRFRNYDVGLVRWNLVAYFKMC